METQARVLVILGYITIVAILYFRRARAGKYSHLPLPPGPRKFPLIGNILNIPSWPQWETSQMGERIQQQSTIREHIWPWLTILNPGTDIVYINVAGTSVVVLDTSEAAIELLERRSAIYSSRPHFHMAGDLLKWGPVISLQKYGENWRLQRRVVHQSFHPTAAALFRPYLLDASRKLLGRLLDNSDNVSGNVRHMATEVILKVAYGVEIKPKDDPYIKIAECAQDGFVSAGIPGAYLVDSFPILKFVPEWFPGADFKRKAKRWSKATLIMREEPFEATKKMRAAGKAKHSFVSSSLDNMDDDDDTETEKAIQHAALSLYGAGTDTTLSAITSCILALLENPSVLKKAQEELDRVIKPGHLPDFEDQESLPYITAITMEILRYRDVVPLGLPHCLMVEDEYKGYRIPAGTIVLANSWAMLHAENVYHDPFTFNPDRFMQNGTLNKKVEDPAHACWGFGRRICPGRYMAFSSVWITLASIISVFDIKKATDKEGNIIKLTHEYLPGLVYRPKSFKCSFTPRSKQAERLIRAYVDPEFSDGV